MSKPAPEISTRKYFIRAHEEHNILTGIRASAEYFIAEPDSMRVFNSMASSFLAVDRSILLAVGGGVLRA